MDLSRYDNRAFDRGASCWKEALWRLCQGLFFQPLWHVPSGIRVGLMRLFGAKIGRRVVVRAGVNVHFPWRLETGDDVWLGEDALILSLGRVKIGSHVCISQRAMICTGSHDYRGECFDLVVEPVEIGDRCWVGAMAFVGPGVKLPPGTVVAAGAVLVKSPEAPGLYAGNPARRVETGG